MDRTMIHGIQKLNFQNAKAAFWRWPSELLRSNKKSLVIVP
jgi:hypothetical protein